MDKPSSSAEPIGFLGGTGQEARGLALRFGQAGFTVLLGSRSAERAQSRAAELRSILAERQCPANVSGVTNQELFPLCRLLFLTVPPQSAPDLLKSCSPFFTSQHIVVDVTVPVIFKGGQMEMLHYQEGSSSSRLFHLLPEETPLVAAFKTIPSLLLNDLDQTLDCDVFLAGDSHDAKRKLSERIAQIPNLRVVDAGSLTQARTLEYMSALAIGINRRYKVKTARFHVVGL